MRTQALYCAKRAVLAAAIILGVFALVPRGAQAQQDKPAQQTAKKASVQPPQSIDERIEALHDKLRITGDQEAAWSNLAQVMRENSTKMQARIAHWANQAGKMSAIENLRAQSDMAVETVESFRKLIPVFETLYGTLSDDQKKAADTMFDNPQGQQAKKAKK